MFVNNFAFITDNQPIVSSEKTKKHVHFQPQTQSTTFASKSFTPIAAEASLTNSQIPIQSIHEFSPTSTKFVLRNIDPSQIDRDFLMTDIQEQGLKNIVSDLQSPSDELSKVTTSLEMKGVSKARSKPHDTIIISEDVTVRLFVTPVTTNTPTNIKVFAKHSHCWFCRHTVPMDWHPVGLPIKHRYVVNDTGQKIDQFDCEGVFCSFNCCIAYLNEHIEYRYKDSAVLVAMLYRKIFNQPKMITNIMPSPSWKLLKEYGGHLHIEDYRKCIQFIEYKSMQQILYKQELKIQNGTEVFVET